MAKIVELKESNNQNLTLRVSQNLVEALKRKSKESNMTQSEFVREAIKQATRMGK